MKSSPRLILTLAAYVFCVGAIIFLHIHVRDLKDDVARNIRALEDAPAVHQQTRSIKKDLLDAEQKMKKISENLVSQDELVQVVDSIAQAGRLSGVLVQVPAVQSDPAASGVLEDIRIRMNVAGSSPALVAFIYRLEHLPYVIRIASFTLDASRVSNIQSFSGVAPSDPTRPKISSGGSLTVDAIISIIKQ